MKPLGAPGEVLVPLDVPQPELGPLNLYNQATIEGLKDMRRRQLRNATERRNHMKMLMAHNRRVRSKKAKRGDGFLRVKRIRGLNRIGRVR